MCYSNAKAKILRKTKKLLSSAHFTVSSALNLRLRATPPLGIPNAEPPMTVTAV
jgi:hypothetical protein